MFKTELHCHSKDISFCSSASVDDIIAEYTAAGYSTLMLANHFEPATMRRREAASYEDFVKMYVSAWEKLRDAAAGRINVLFGAELRFECNLNDYLLFGATPEFLLSHPDIFSMTPASFSECAREAGVLFVQAHPFRNNMTLVDPKYLDGVEVFNGHGGHDSRNPIAEVWAERFSLIKTSGSDYHHPSHKANSGILTEREIKTVSELVATLRSGKYELIKGNG